jgi:hypothetical protein
MGMVFTAFCSRENCVLADTGESHFIKVVAKIEICG